MDSSIGIIGILFYLAILAFFIAVGWKIFEKAGKPGWASIIPIYSAIVLCDIVGKPRWWVLLFLVPIANVVIGIWLVNMLSKSFGKEEGFTVGLLLIPIVFYPILAFGDAKYQGPYGLKATGGYTDNSDVIDSNI